MSISLYRKYRPQTFGDVVGQKSAVDILTNSISRGKVGHAYLFSGSRGCGKTSCARIFAKALNCLDRQGYEPCGKCRNCQDITAGEALDVVEIDGASNNGVDNIRGLKENVALAPFTSRYKIYIIDEVHMLSQGAFNALLKTLEEPPEHVIFIMATTEPHKVPVTIRSRCQHIPFRSITPDDISSRLEFVCQNEGIAYEAEALREISRQADGALRDALSLLEQVSASGNVTLKAVEEAFGAGSRPAFERWIVTLRENPEAAYTGLSAMFDAGASGVRVLEELFTLLRDLLLVSRWKGITESLPLSHQEKSYLEAEAPNWSSGDLHRLMRSVLRILTEARSGTRPDILLGMLTLVLTERAVLLEAPRSPQPTLRAKSPVSPPTPPQPSKPETLTPSPKPEIREDPGLKEELIAAARKRNFLVWCAMYDSHPYRRGNDLVLDMAHIYCCSVMRIDRLAAEISGIFADYDSVILRYGVSEYICPRRTFPVTAQASPPAPVAHTAPATFTATAPPPKPDPKPEPKKPPSAFAGIITGLRSMGLKPEVIIHKRTDSDNDTDDTAEGDDDE